MSQRSFQDWQVTVSVWFGDRKVRYIPSPSLSYLMEEHLVSYLSAHFKGGASLDDTTPGTTRGSRNNLRTGRRPPCTRTPALRSKSRPIYVKEKLLADEGASVALYG